MSNKINYLLITVLLLTLFSSITFSEENTKTEETKNEAPPRRGRPVETWGIKGNFKTWGLIAGYSSPYRKTQDETYIILPLLDHPFFKYMGFQKDFYINPMVAITPGLTYNGKFALNSNDLHGKYNDLDNRYGDIEAGLGTSVNLGFINGSIGIKANTNNVSNGVRYYASIGGRAKVKVLPMMSYKLTFNSYNENYMDYYFGISKKEAEKLNINEYHPGACGSVELSLSFMFPLKPNTMLILSSGMEQFGEKFDSDILESRTTTKLGAMLSWTPM